MAGHRLQGARARTPADQRVRLSARRARRGRDRGHGLPAFGVHTGSEVTATVSLNGLTASFQTPGGPQPVDAAGVEWTLPKLTGWYGPPAPRTARTDRPGAPGAWRAAAYRGARIVGLEIVATAATTAGMRAGEQRVEARCAAPAPFWELVVPEGSGSSRVAMVELDDATLMAPR